MATQRGFRREFYIQDTQREDTYDTDPLGTNVLHKVDSEPANLESELIDDTDLISGSEEATELVNLSRSTSMSISAPRVKSNTLGVIAALAAGSNVTDADTVTNPSGTAYKHQIVPVIDEFELPSVTVTENLVPGSYGYKYQGMMVDSFTLSAERKGWFALTADLMGSGTKTSNAGAASGSEVSEPALKAGDAKIWYASDATGYAGTRTSPTTTQDKVTGDLTGTEVEIDTKLVNFNWTYNNNIAGDDLYSFNSGLVKDRSERTRRNQSLTLTVEFEDFTWLDFLTAETQIALEIECISATQIAATGYYYGFNLLFPLLQIRSATLTGGTDKLMVDLDVLVLQSATDGSFVLDVYNTVSTAYATT